MLAGLELRVLAVLAIAGGAVLGVNWWAARERQAGAAAVTAQVQAAGDAASARAAAVSLARAQAQGENFREATRHAEDARLARAAQDARTAAVSDRLRDHITDVRSRGTAGDPAAAGQCATDRAALADVLQSCRAAVVDLGRDADAALDAARIRHAECAADYDALTAPAP